MGNSPLRPARPKEKDAREHGYEVIRVTHREARAAATEMRRYGNETELSLPIRFMNTSPRSSLRVTATGCCLLLCASQSPVLSGHLASPQKLLATNKKREERHRNA